MKSFKAQAWVLPQPVMIIGTYNADGSPNAMNAARGDQWDIYCTVVATYNSCGGRRIIGINNTTYKTSRLSYNELLEISTGAGRRVRRALKYDPDAVFSNGVSDKEITHAANEFVITIPRKSNQDQEVTDQVTDQPQPKSDQVTHKSDPVSSKSEQATDQLQHKPDQPRFKLSKKQEDIRNFCSVPRTAREILERAGVATHFDNRKKYIYDLVAAGVLEPTIPDKAQ